MKKGGFGAGPRKQKAYCPTLCFLLYDANNPTLAERINGLG